MCKVSNDGIDFNWCMCWNFLKNLTLNKVYMYYILFLLHIFDSKWHIVCISIASELGKRTAALFIVEPNFDSAFLKEKQFRKSFQQEMKLTWLSFFYPLFLVKLYNFLWSDSETIIGQKNDRKVLIKQEMMHFLYCTVWELF